MAGAKGLQNLAGVVSDVLPKLTIF